MGSTMSRTRSPLSLTSAILDGRRAFRLPIAGVTEDNERDEYPLAVVGSRSRSVRPAGVPATA